MAGPGQPLSADAVSSRAMAGAVLVGLRGMAVRLIGLLGYLVLARLLDREDFGIAALGLTFTIFGQMLTDAGVAAALIRRPEPPDRRLLSAVLGFQLVVATTFTAGVACWALLSGAEAAIAVTLFVASLVPYALRVPSIVSLERDLEYRPIVTAEVVEVVVFNVLGVVAAASGLGVIGVGAAAIVKIVVGSVLMLRLSSVPLLRPRIDLPATRELLRTGIGFQATGAVLVVREQAWATGIAAVGGLATLGLWTIAARVCSVPGLLLETLWRVSYPAVARLIESGANPRRALERGCETAALLAPLMLVPLAVAGADTLAVLLGEEWREAAEVLPFMAVALAVRLPVSVVAVGYLYATGRVRTVLLAEIALSLSLVASGAVLLPVLGYRGLGLAWLIAAVVDTALLGRALARHADVSPWRHVARGLVLAGVAGLAAFGVDEALGAPPAVEALVVTAAAVTAYGVLALVFARAGLTRSIGVVGRGMRGALGRSERAVAQDELTPASAV